MNGLTVNAVPGFINPMNTTEFRRVFTWGLMSVEAMQSYLRLFRKITHYFIPAFNQLRFVADTLFFSEFTVNGDLFKAYRIYTVDTDANQLIGMYGIAFTS